MRVARSALVAAMLFVFAAVSQAGPGVPETLRSPLPDPRITIGSPYTKTGRWASFGAEWRTVFEIYQKNINNMGGVLVNGTRYAVDFILVDVGADELADMVTNTQIAITGALSSVDFIVGPYSSTLTEAALKVVDSSKLFLAPGASADSLFVCDGTSDSCRANTRRHTNLFSTALRAGLLFEGIVNLATVHGAKSFAYFYEDTLFTKAACAGVQTQIQERNLKVVTADVINAVGQGNLSAETEQQLNKILTSYKKTNPDFVIGCTYQYSCEHVINMLRKIDFVPLGLALSTCVGREDLLEAVGLDSRYVVGPALWHPRLTGPAYVEDDSHPVGFFARDGVSAPQEFYRQFEYQAGTDPTYTAASVMASLYALTTAFVRSGSVQPAQVSTRMNVLMLSSSFYGPIAFDTFGRLTFPPLTIQYDLNNEPRVLTPLSAADGDFAYPFPTFAQRNCLEAKTCGLNGQCQRDGECLCAPGWTGTGCNTADIKIRTILEKDRCKGLYGAVVALLILWIFFAGLTLVGCICWKRDKSRFARYSATPDSEPVTSEVTEG